MKYLRFAAALVSTCVAIPVGTSFADPLPGHRSGTTTMSYFGYAEGVTAIASFGRCYAGQNWRGAFELLATEPGSRAEADTYRRLFHRHHQSCLSDVVRLRMPLPFVRGAIAEGLYRRGYAVPQTMRLAAPDAGSTARTFSEAARCYAAGHRDQVHALITGTNPGSREEFDLVTAMAPEFTRCVPAHVRTQGFNATEIRFRLAEALLRLGLMPSAASPR